MKTPLLIAAPVLAGALVIGAAAPALADGAPTPDATHGRTLAAVQARGAADTSKRIASLNAAIARVTAAKGISDADRTTVLATFNADLGAMTSLAAKIAADTTVATAGADVRSVFTGYRVYVVALPQARVATAADRLTGTTIPRLQASAAKLAPKVAGDSALQAKLADMNAQIATAQKDADGLAAAALAVTPADYNADHTAMSSLTAKAKAAVAAAKQAAADARAIRQALRK